jgi:hypothetical protein
MHQRQERFSFPYVSNAVKSEQIGHVASLEADPPEFHTADLGVGRADRVTGCSGSDSTRFTKPT